MKEGFFKTNWRSVLLVIIFLGASIVIMETVTMIITFVFVVGIAYTYFKFDSLEQKHDAWWGGLDKGEKFKIYEKIHS